ncbi:MAG TPA: hypothetical protein PKC24_15745 [Cyclobacteriaceae bacterium]|nr:hypothetical protein [Cyclobacteriaceae bacterium]
MHTNIDHLKNSLDQKAALLSPYLLHRYQITRLGKALDLLEQDEDPPHELTREFQLLLEQIKTDLPVLKQDINQYDQRFRALFRKARMHYAKSAPGRNLLIGLFSGAFAGATAALIWHLPVWTNSIGIVLGLLIGILSDLYAERKGKVL